MSAEWESAGILIGYYRCTAKVERNAQFPIHVLFNIKDWPENVLKQRCLLGNRFFHRPATPGEVEAHAGNKRAMSYVYRSARALIEDEARIVDIDTLEAIAKAYNRPDELPWVTA
jgi:hypothetical protein